MTDRVHREDLAAAVDAIGSARHEDAAADRRDGRIAQGVGQGGDVAHGLAGPKGEDGAKRRAGREPADDVGGVADGHRTGVRHRDRQAAGRPDGAARAHAANIGERPGGGTAAECVRPRTDRRGADVVRGLRQPAHAPGRSGGEADDRVDGLIRGVEAADREHGSVAQRGKSGQLDRGGELAPGDDPQAGPGGARLRRARTGRSGVGGARRGGSARVMAAAQPAAAHASTASTAVGRYAETMDCQRLATVHECVMSGRAVRGAIDCGQAGLRRPAGRGAPAAPWPGPRARRRRSRSASRGTGSPTCAPPR